MATYDESKGGYHRVMEIDPYRPARTELIGDDTRQASSKDVGKAVKLDGAGVDLCADGEEIYALIESVGPQSENGYSVGGCLSASGNQGYATATGTIEVGDLVVSAATPAYGTPVAATGTPVKKAAGSEPGIHRWVVVAKYTTPANGLLIRKL